jgi:hypothetical protein
VFPGVPEVLASVLCSTIILINEDLPTLLLPRNANSGLSAFGQEATSGLEIRYEEEWMIMLMNCFTKVM